MNVPLALDEAQLETSALSQTVGIGFPYLPALSPEFYQSGVLDFVEIIPETLCRERRNGDRVSIALIPAQVERARTVCNGLPIVAHGVELSIGSAHGCNGAYLDMLDEFQRQWPFMWHSEHLGFQTYAGMNQPPIDIGVPLPLPATTEVVRMVAERGAAIRARYGVPFILENPAHYLSDLPSDPEVGDEIELMNLITEIGGCGHLLDLHNLYCNAINHRFDAFAAIDRMKLDRVLEIHVAGGSWLDGFWMDAHDSTVPRQVWELLEYTLPRCPNVAGVVFELLERHALRLGIEAIAEEIQHTRDIWMRGRAATVLSLR